VTRSARAARSDRPERPPPRSSAARPRKGLIDLPFPPTREPPGCRTRRSPDWLAYGCHGRRRSPPGRSPSAAGAGATRRCHISASCPIPPQGPHPPGPGRTDPSAATRMIRHTSTRRHRRSRSAHQGDCCESVLIVGQFRQAGPGRTTPTYGA
jgi:hypothetical protein